MVFVTAISLLIGVHGVDLNTPLQPHQPVFIDGNNEFTPANGVVAGSGTASDPYVIQGWQFTLNYLYYNLRGTIDIRNTTAYFIIQTIRVSPAKASDQNSLSLSLRNVTNAVIRDSRFSSISSNIIVANSSRVLIEDNGFSSDIWIGSVGDININSNITIRGNSFGGLGPYGGVALAGFAYTYRNILIYHNNFYGADILYPGTPGRWDNGYPSGGNFWHEARFDNKDKCSGPTQNICGGPDGISDLPDGPDHYPLMAPNPTAPDIIPPLWGSYSYSLNASSITSTSVVLAWPTATDDHSVVSYRIYRGTNTSQNGTLLATVPSTVNTYTLTGLTLGTSYLVWVEAGDAAGQWGELLSTSFTTLNIWQQYWYVFVGGGVAFVAGLLIWDRIRTKRRGPKPTSAPEALERLRQAQPKLSQP